MSSRSPQTVLFLGDSITHAHRRPEELHDCYQLGSGYVASAAGELGSFEAAAEYRFLNHGECGFTVQNLLERWEGDLVTARATIVSILIGINDAHSAEHRIDVFRDTYQQLLLSIRVRLPAVKLMLLEPFGLPVQSHDQVDIISPQQLERLSVIQSVVRELAADAGARFLPMQHLFSEPPAKAWTLDGIHPSAAGHWRIARAWTAAVRQAGWFPPLPQQGETT